MPDVTLREITEATLSPFLKMKVAPAQERFVASNAVSIAQAHFAQHAWFRGVYADEEPVGFIMLHLNVEGAEFWVWRLMIAQEHQRRGYGRAAMEQAIAHVRGLPGATELHVSFVPGEGNPSPLYLGLGFEDTGKVEEGEQILRLTL